MRAVALDRGDAPSLVSALTDDVLQVSRHERQMRLQRVETCPGRLSDEHRAEHVGHPLVVSSLSNAPIG